MNFLGSIRPLHIGLALLWPVLVVVAYFFNYKDPFFLNQRDKSNVNAWLFTDSLDNGHSIVRFDTSAKKEHIKIVYTLKEGYQYPYVGVNFLLNKDSLPDLSKYDYVQMRIRAKQGSRLPIVIGLWEGEEVKPNGNRFLEYILPVSKDWNTVKIDFSNFRSPEWWLKLNEQKEKDLQNPDFSQMRFLNVQSCQILGNDKEDVIELKEVSLRVNMIPFYIATSLLSILYFVVLALIFYRKKNNKSVIFSYNKTEAVSHSKKEEETVFSFITSNYDQANLSILEIQNGTGISEAKISSVIKNKSGLTFKQFLNKLRLTESKRLLLETDLQISEIAYKVGYSNVSHFNRIFKEVENCTPNDFRKQTSAK